MGRLFGSYSYREETTPTTEYTYWSASMRHPSWRFMSRTSRPRKAESGLTYRPGSAASMDHYPCLLVRPTIESPDDLTYEEGTTGYEIIWNASASFPERYVVQQNETPVMSNEWDGYQIVVNVDGRALGTYEYVLTVEDTLGGSASDTVLVNVTVAPATAPPTDMDRVLIAGAASTVVVLMAAICILFSRRA